MRLALTSRFQQDAASLPEEQRAVLFEVILALPRAIGAPHTHAGLGMRKVHASGIWEARVGLGLRLVFTIEPEVTTLVRVGSHEDVRRFLRTL